MYGKFYGRFYGKFDACVNSVYQTLSLPPQRAWGRSYIVTVLMHAIFNISRKTTSDIEKFISWYTMGACSRKNLARKVTKFLLHVLQLIKSSLHCDGSFYAA